MTNQDQLNKELREKVKAGIKPSQLKRSRSAEELTPKEIQSDELTKLQTELNSLKEKLQGQNPTLLLKAREELINIRTKLQPLFPTESLRPSELVTKLITEKNTLQDQLDTKRLASLQEFSKFQEQIKDLASQESLALAQLKQQISTCQKENQVLAQRIKLLRSELSYNAEPTWPSSVPLNFWVLVFGGSCLIALLTHK